jgi:hypothetical protein
MNQNEEKTINFGNITNKKMNIQNFSNIITNEALLKETDVIKQKISLLDSYINQLKLNLSNKKNKKIKLILDLQTQLKNALETKEQNLTAIQKNHLMIEEIKKQKKKIELKATEDFLIKRKKLNKELEELRDEVDELTRFKQQKV